MARQVSAPGIVIDQRGFSPTFATAEVQLRPGAMKVESTGTIAPGVQMQAAANAIPIRGRFTRHVLDPVEKVGSCFR
jgi:hypothetical protein